MGDAGGNEEFEAFVRANSAALRRLAHARTGDGAIAEDLVQDVLTDAFRRWSRIGGYDDPAAWARRAVLNRSISRWRSWGRESRAVTRLGARRVPEVVIEPQFFDAALWSCLRGLPRRQLQVALLLWFEEMTVAEVADTLGCSHETVRTHWRRARERLAVELASHTDAAGDTAAEPSVVDGGVEP